MEATAILATDRPKLLQTSDIPEVMRILSQLYDDESEYPVGGGWTSLQIERELEYGLGLGIFGENYRLRAFVLFRMVSQQFEISILATERAERRKGLMTQLLAFMRTSWRGGRTLWLEVHEKNSAAQKLYEKQGFTQEGVRHHYYRDGASALLYTLR
ncbi:MAG: GNAT family N-acetyltransferase [Bdellovibrionales bacterium]|nr:GNAT family N-acetyltransferase [Bdellovibrionales bacterium]